MVRLFLAVLALLCGPALTVLAADRPCADFKSGPRPQNTPRAYVGQTLDEITERGTMEFALYEDNFPFSYESHGKVEGVDADIARLLAQALGVKAELRLVQAGENLDADLLNYVWKGAAVDGHVSNVMMRVPYNPDYACRVDQAFMTGQYATETIAIAYDEASYPDGGPKPAYFRYDTVAVENDSISDFYLTSMGDGQANSKIHRYPSMKKAMEALARHEVMAAMGPRSQLAAGLAKGIALHEPPMPGFALSRWTVGIAVHQSHRDIGYALDEEISKALSDGRIEAIYKKHGLPFTPPVR